MCDFSLLIYGLITIICLFSLFFVYEYLKFKKELNLRKKS